MDYVAGKINFMMECVKNVYDSVNRLYILSYCKYFYKLSFNQYHQLIFINIMKVSFPTQQAINHAFFSLLKLINLY